MAEPSSDEQYRGLVDLVSSASDQFPWSPQEFPSIWEHLSAGPLAALVVTVDPVQAIRAEQICRDASRPMVSFGDLLRRSCADTALLEIVLTCAQAHLSNPHPTLPEPIAKAMYNLTLLLIRCGQNSSLQTVSDKELSNRVEWLSTLQWLDKASNTLIAEGREVLPPLTDG